MWTRAPFRIPWARPAWLTCSSTWPSKAPTRSAPPTTPPKNRLWKRSKPPTPLTSPSESRVSGGMKRLEKAWKDATAEADKYVKPNEFGKIVEQNGGEDMNASTSLDMTEYHYS